VERVAVEQEKGSAVELGLIGPGRMGTNRVRYEFGGHQEEAPAAKGGA